MIQRGSDISFTNLWSLLLYIELYLHYVENAQEKNNFSKQTTKLNMKNKMIFRYIYNVYLSI